MGCRCLPQPSAMQQPCRSRLPFGALSRTAAFSDVLQGIASQNASGPLVASPLSKVSAASRIVSAEAALMPGSLHRQSI